MAWLVLGVLFLLCMVTLMFGAFNLEARKPDPRSRPGARWPVARLRPASPRVSVNASRRTAMSAITSRRPAEVVGVSVRPATRVNAGRLASNAAIPAGTVARPAPAVALATPTPYAASAAGAAKTARFCPTFRVGRRHDFQLTMAPIFVELGLCPTESPAFDVFWGLTLNEPKAFSSPLLARRGIPADAIFNSVPRMMQTVGVKPSIASLQYDCEIHVLSAALRSGPLSAPGWCAFTQRGFNARREEKLSAVRLDYGRLRAYSKERERATGTFPSVWILKSIVAFAQRGIQLVLLRKEDVTSDRALATWAELHMPRGDFTLQEYLREPMLWQDRKFDMRALALVTSVEPLRFYVLDHAFPKIASQAYTLDLAALKDECVHFKMPVCAGTSVDPYPRSTDAPRFRDHLVPPLADATDWDRRLYPKLYTALLRVILVARRHLLPAEQSLVRKGFAQKRVQVLQPDVLFDKQGHAWIVEMNTNGFMVGSLHKEFFDATPQMRSAVEIAGVNRCAREQGRGEEREAPRRAPCCAAARGFGSAWRAMRRYAHPRALRRAACRAPPAAATRCARHTAASRRSCSRPTAACPTGSRPPPVASWSRTAFRSGRYSAPRPCAPAA